MEAPEQSLKSIMIVFIVDFEQANAGWVKQFAT